MIAPVYYISSTFFTILGIIGMWFTFEKAGQPGWAAIVPFYNWYIILTIADCSTWWILLWLIPGVNVVFAIIVYLRFAECFGQGILFALGLTFFPGIFYAILGFSNMPYNESVTPFNRY